ncbi:MAG: hypothetical protein IT287_09415 [Bdellovibrionaceae bacterium]|nr:hypothetical protein [Pseudobdellovibrionaceae bacterium]
MNIFKKFIRLLKLRSSDLDGINDLEHEQKVLRKARHSDYQGNYADDGVSFDGKEIYVAGEEHAVSPPNAKA